MFNEPRIKVDAVALYESLLIMRAFVEQQGEQIRYYSENLEQYVKEEEIETIVAGRENRDEVVNFPARHISGFLALFRFVWNISLRPFSVMSLETGLGAGA